MNLKPQERQAILQGHHPKIVRPDEDGCPFDVGETIVLTTQSTDNGLIPQVSITITGHNRHKNGAWEAIYTVKDDRGLYLDQGSGYTRSAGRSIDPEAPVLDPEAQEEYAAQSRLKTAERTAGSKNERQQRERGVQRRLREAMKGLGEQGQVELLARIERDIREASSEAA